MRKIVIAALLALAASWPASAPAQDWPTRPVTLIVPFAAGGPVDVVARIVAPRISEILGQQIVVENIGGAGGMVGASRVEKAAPDGYTFLFGTQGTHTFGQVIYKRPQYNAITDFQPVGQVVSNVKVLVVRKDLPANNLAEFIAYAKANADKMSYASAGTGSATHAACLLLTGKLGLKITHVPYRGAGPALQDLVAGRIDFMCDIVSTSLPQIRGNTIRALAMMSNARSRVLPEIPTAIEQGLEGVDAEGWNAFFFPKGTPDAIVRKLNAATVQALDSPAVRERIEGLGLFVPKREELTPEFLGKLILLELDKWGPPMKAAGISID